MGSQSSGAAPWRLRSLLWRSSAAAAAALPGVAAFGAGGGCCGGLGDDGLGEGEGDSLGLGGLMGAGGWGVGGEPCGSTFVDQLMPMTLPEAGVEGWGGGWGGAKRRNQLGCVGIGRWRCFQRLL